MIAVIDYGVGNLFSLTSSLSMIGAECVVTRDPETIKKADKILLPGVGACSDAKKKLTDLGAKSAALTGISFEKSKIGVYYYDSVTDQYYYYCNEYLPASFHGTGDIYASATLGAMMRDFTVPESLSIAVDFTLLSMKKTLDDPTHRFYGVNFEEALPYYIERINSK